MFQLAASAEMLFRDLPFVERVARLTDLGFQVEMWSWKSKDVAALKATGATFSSMTGYLSGDLLSAKGIGELLESAEQSIEVAKRLNCPRLNLHGSELSPEGPAARPTPVVTGEMWLTAQETLSRVADLGRRAGVVFMLENLNTEVDHPGVPFSKAGDTLALIKSIDSPNLRLNLDLYHVQIGEGNLIETVRKALPYIGEIQVADVPGRCEPGTGEINYPAVAKALADSGYRGTVGLEAWPSSDDMLALQRFKAAFSVD